MPFARNGFGRERFAASRHTDQHDAAWRVRLSALVSAVKPIFARSSQDFSFTKPPSSNRLSSNG